MENKTPEISDITEMIRRYLVVNPDCVLIFSAVGYKQSEDVCEECGDCMLDINDDASKLAMFGELEELRNLLNTLRDVVEDEHDGGFVSI